MRCRVNGIGVVMSALGAAASSAPNAGCDARLGQAEVEQLGDHARFGSSRALALGARRAAEKDVARLQIPMHDAEPVSLVERIGHLRGDAHRRRERQRASREAIGERLALEVLEHQEIETGVLADVVQRADVRMIERGDGPRLALEAHAEVGVARDVGGEHFDGDQPIESSVTRPIDFAHAAGADGSLDDVRTESRADGERHGRARGDFT